jgi:hypothetical protein
VISQKLVDEILPQSVWDEILRGKFKDLMKDKIHRGIIVDQVEKKIKELCQTIDIANEKQAQAMYEIRKLDQPNGLVAGFEGSLEELVKTICRSIDETIDEYGLKVGPIADGQPALVNEVAKAALRDPVLSGVIKDSAHSMVAICLARIFQTRPNQRPEERLSELMNGLIAAFNSADPKATATAWLKEFLPEDLRLQLVPPFLQATMTHEFLVDLILKDYVPEEQVQVEMQIKELCQAINTANEKQAQAMIEIRKLDQPTGVVAGFEGGLEELVKTIFKSVDETIDEYGTKPGLIAEGQSLLVNELAKGALRVPVLSKVIKDSAHSMIAICLARVFQTGPNQKPEERLLEVMKGLMAAFNSADPKATATAWLKEFLPEDLRLQVVPPSLQATMTHEFLADLILKDYIPEVQTVVDLLNAAPKGDDQDAANEEIRNLGKLQKYVKETVGKYKDPNFSKEGLSGLGGFIKSLETKIVGAIAGNERGQPYEGVGKLLEDFLDSSVSHVMSGPQMKKVLHKQFLSEAMIVALPAFGEADPGKDLPTLRVDQLVDLTPEGLKRLGIELKRYAGETDESFRPRVVNKYFELQCGKLACEVAFPRGALDLPVPKVAQDSVFNKIPDAIGTQIGRIVNRNERLLFLIDFFGVDESNKKNFLALEDLLKATGDFGNNEKTVERMFKNRLLAFAMKKIDEYFAGWPRFFRGIASGFVKFIARAALKWAVSQQIWNLVSDKKNDVKFRSLVWKLLSFAKVYDPIEKDKKELSKEVTKAFGQGFKDMGILAGVRSKAASAAAGVLSDQNFINLIT